MRRALLILTFMALPGLIFGSLVQALASGEADCVPAGESRLLSGFGPPPCPSTDLGALLASGLFTAIAVLVVIAVRVRPR